MDCASGCQRVSPDDGAGGVLGGSGQGRVPVRKAAEWAKDGLFQKSC